MKALRPEEIVEYMHQEFTPYASMNEAEGKAHIAGLIQRYAEEYAREQILDFQKELSDAINSIQL